MGRPKALVPFAGEPLVLRALRALRDGGTRPLVVVLGAGADEAAPLVPADVTVVVAPDWADGMGASLRAGLAAVEPLDVDAVLVHLVDLPGVGPEAVARLVDGSGPHVLRRAGFAGVPGHPVLLGRDHWPGVRDVAHGDSGARRYLAGNPALELVECGDVAAPDDVDTPDRLR
jgi:nicotine blue oxidoreductase